MEKGSHIRNQPEVLANLRDMALYNAAISFMPCGFSMWNDNLELVLFNQRYLDIYKLPAEKIVTGLPLFQLCEISLDLRYERDLGNAGNQKNIEFDEYYSRIRQSLLAHQDPDTHTYDKRIIWGRTIRVSIARRPGFGWFVTHEDVTDSTEQLDALKNREAELSLQNSRFEAAVGNMAHGLAMFDADERLVICNDPYLKIYDLPSEFGKSGTKSKDILEYRIAHGSVPVDEQGMGVREIALAVTKGVNDDGKPINSIWELQNGKQVSVSYRSISDGGWVSIHEDVTQRLKEVDQIRHLAHHDSLTNLPNRTFFVEELEKAETRMVRGEQIAILCLDLDCFKEINDNLGHGVGDEVLKQVAERLNVCVREHEMVARMGGDEFMILIGPLEKPQQAALVAKRVLEEFNRPMIVEGHQLKIGTSIGIAVAPLDGSDGATLMKNADRALYRAKKDGGGVFHFFEKGMDSEIHRRQSMEVDLVSALDKNQFSLAFQPILELETNRISSCEVLVNWNHPKLGRLGTADFVQLANETGVNDKLVKWMFEQACKEAATWPEQVRVTINMSTFRFGGINLPDVIKAALKHSGLDPARLEIGVSECYLIKNTKPTLKILHKLRALGVRLSVDEFGKESTSLNHLRTFSFDKISFDRTFVADTMANQESREIAKAVIGLGHSLGIVMNAVGIDKECQLDFMRDLGCNEVQGYLFSVPLPEHSIGELLRTVERRAAVEMGIACSSDPIDRVMDL